MALFVGQALNENVNVVAARLCGVFCGALTLFSAGVAQAPDYVRLFRELQRAQEAQLSTMREHWRGALATVAGGAELVDALVEFRRFELTDAERAAERARQWADRARDRAAGNAWMHYAYALVVAHGPDVQSNGPVLRATGRSWAKELGLDARARARRAAERALELDSLHAGAAAIYGEIALQLLEDEELQRARTTLQRAVTATSDPAASLVLARVLAQFNDPVGAIAASERATRAEPDNPFALHAHALALFRYPGKEAEGARQYFAAVERASPGFAERLFEELRPLATPADTVRFSRAALDQRKVLMRDFWNVRAALGGVTVAERLAEHYRRLAVALDFYPRLRGGPARQENVVWEAMTLPIDARGQLYVRHGAPWKISVTPSIGRNSAACRELTTWTGRSRLGATTLGGASGTRLGMPAAEKAGPRAEVWAYQTEAGMRAFALVRCLDAPDYYLPYTIPCGLEFPPEFEVQSFDIHSCDADTRERMRDWARSALSTETHSPNISRRIPLNFDLLSFRGRAGTTDLLAPIALLSDSILSTRTATGQLRYTLALQLAVIDTARQTVTHSADTISFLLAEPLAKGDRLSRHALVRAAPTDYAFLRLVVRNLEHDNNGATRTELIRVPAYAGDTLMVSDLVLGGDVQGGNFERGGRRIALMPFARFTQGRFRIFYELYNLPVGTTYQTQLLVQPDSGRPQDGLRTDFQDEAAPDSDGVVRVLRTMGTELQPGRYRLTVRIRLPNNRFVEKTRQFIVGAGS